MAIASKDQYLAAQRQRIRIIKTPSRTTVAVMPYSMFDLVGNPGAGVLAGTSTAQGVMPTDATVGCPDIEFTTGIGYLSRVEFACSVACRLAIYDMLFKAGAYAYGAATTTVTDPPEVSSRCPDYPGSGTTFGSRNEIWLEVSTTFATGNAWTLQVTYTNSLGETGRTTPAMPVFAAAALVIGKMWQLPLQSGDSGVQKIESVIVTNPATAMTAGAFNILILRPLITSMRVPVPGGGAVLDMFATGMPIVYNNSAIIVVENADSTALGVPEVALEIASA
jgi:hypothetical protein